MRNIERYEQSPPADYVFGRIVEFVSLAKETNPNALAKKDEDILTKLTPHLPPKLAEEVRLHFLMRQKNDKELILAEATDALTQLPDRRFFFRYLLPGLKKKGVNTCFCIRIDLASLKDFNRSEIWGDNGGDAVIAATSNILKELAERFNGVPIRFHGDTFMLVFETRPRKLNKIVSDGVNYFQQVDAEALIRGSVLNKPLIDYSEDPPLQIKLPRSGYQKLLEIADGEYAKILLPVKTAFTTLSLDLTYNNEYIKSALQEADNRCKLKKERLMEQLRERYPKGVHHLLRRI